MSETTSVSIFALGGCGTNQLKKILESKEHVIPTDVKMCVIDTSESNREGLDEDIQFHLLSAHGSGKDRRTNSDLIYDQIEKMDIAENIGNINIIISSLAGGTGSVIANMLATKCANMNQCTISMCVVDTSSHKSCENSINAIRSYDNMAKKYNLYFPIMIYNNDDNGRRSANEQLVGDLAALIKLFDNDIEELDHRDKVHFLNPSMINPGLVGVYNLGITAGSGLNTASENVPGANNTKINLATTIHSLMCTNPDGKCAEINTMVDYIGISDDEYVVVNGVAIDPELVKKLRLKAEQFRNRNVNQTQLESLDLGDTDENNGLVI